MIILSTIILSSGSNRAWVSAQCGCMPSVLVHGKPGTGKSTCIDLVSKVYNCQIDTSLLILTDVTPSALWSLNSTALGCVRMLSLYLFGVY